MELFGNPSKKIRLSFDDSFSNAVENDENLWGNVDFTAEEFDQATQSCVQRNDTNADIWKPVDVSSQHAASNGAFPHDEELELQQDALNGKVKYLQDSLDKSEKDLREERLNRENIIGKRLEEYKKKEEGLRKEVEKAQSVLQFKEQEMKTVYEKVHMLEIQLKEKKLNNIEKANDTTEKSPCKFLKRFTFDSKNQLKTVDASIQAAEKSSFCRKYKLKLDVPNGESNCIDLVSSILCNRISTPCGNSPLTCITPLQQSVECSLRQPIEPSSAMALARLNTENNSDELWQSYEHILQEHLVFLQNAKCNSNGSLTNTTFSKSLSLLNSPFSARLADVKSKQMTVLACLKDLTSLLSCRKLEALVEVANLCFTSASEGEKTMPSINETDLESYSCPLFTADDEKMETTSLSTHPLLKLLVTLAHPKTYPQGYESKNEEIEWSLASIVAWSTSSKHKYCIYELPLHELLSGEHGTMCIYLTLNLLLEFAALPQFDAILVHKNEDCLLCTIGYLCIHTVANSPKEHINILMMIENLFSIIFTIHINSKVNLESSPCISKMLQGIITVLWKLYQMDNDKTETVLLALRKGLVLLLQFSTHIQDFKEKRFSVEEQYISLICGFLALSKENGEFKEFYDDIHELWDFQEDTSEFDLYDTGDELSQSTTHDSSE